MKVRVVTTDGETFEYEADDRGVGFLEFPVAGQDPELPAKHWLFDLAEVHVSEHPRPVTQDSPVAEAEWVTLSRGEAIYGAATLEKLRQLPDFDTRLDEPSEVRYRVPRLPKRAPKPKAAA